MNKTQKTFISLSTPRIGILRNGDSDFSPQKYIKKRGLSKYDKILRKICVQLLHFSYAP